MPAPDLSQDRRRQIALDPPRFRGALHSVCVPIAVIAGVIATFRAHNLQTGVLVAVYAVTLVAMFTFSALFHRIRWDDDGWWRMRQLDHTGIYLVIAGSYTGIAGPALSGGLRTGLLIAVWLCTAAGIAYRWLPLVPPFGLTTGLFVLLAGLVVPFLGPVADGIGGAGVAYLLAGCGLYFIGALALGARRPDPWPKTFGYHEIWHVIVVISSALHYVVVVGYALPAAKLASGLS